MKETEEDKETRRHGEPYRTYEYELTNKLHCYLSPSPLLGIFKILKQRNKKLSLKSTDFFVAIGELPG